MAMQIRPMKCIEGNLLKIKYPNMFVSKGGVSLQIGLSMILGC